MTADPPAWLDAQPFEAGFLGGGVYVLRDPARAPEAADWGRTSDARLISCRVPDDDGGHLGAAGFRHVETLITFSRPLRDGEPAKGGTASVRPATIDDIDACRAIAKAAFRSDRFHADPALPDAVADLLKAAWIENSIRGRADHVFVFAGKDRVVGFNAVNRRGDLAVIDLIAVDPEAQRQGAGKAMIAAALAHYSDICRTMEVGTQASNRASLSLYAGMGFAEARRLETWHWTPQ